MFKISIVTVVYNAANDLEVTINSVLKQTYKEIEYIVIDGASTDGTLDVLEKFKDKITTVVSEKDNGIYDAMNKSLQYVTGDWVIFLNAGDVFYQDEVLNEVISQVNDENSPDIIGGGVIIDTGSVFKYEKVKSINQKWIYMPACHQSTLYRFNLLKHYKYDLNYKICADHLLSIDLLNAGAIFYPVPQYISIFKWNGVSAKQRIALFQEKLKIDKQRNAPLLNRIYLLYIISKLKFAKLLRELGLRK